MNILNYKPEELQTRSGSEVLGIFEDKVEGCDPYNRYLVVIKDDEGIGIARVNISGCYWAHGETDKDVVLKPKKLSGFINIYKNHSSSGIFTKEEYADDNMSERIACIDLSQFNEGEGL